VPNSLTRLDAELVRRGLAASRGQASELIDAGRVEVRGVLATKAATRVGDDTPIRISDDADTRRFASRGGTKLAGALASFESLTVAGRTCLDAGASTGGFTDVLLQHGATRVTCVDVGYGQLAWRLRTDERVQVFDRTNVRNLTPEQICGPVDLTVADLSFISLPVVLPALFACTRTGGDVVPMVKPQFEVGRQRLGKSGVVRDPSDRLAAVLGVVAAAGQLGWGLTQIAASPLPGPAGNVEFFLWLRQERPRVDQAGIETVVMEAR
jgi:23S rRNA (cytidine1920-2'-O)/16S rRNA (cytidine1409-2'-O)-methyltransferase